MAGIKIVPIVPYDEGVADGKKLGQARIHKKTERLLRDPSLKDTLGAMSRAELTKIVMTRLQTPPDYGRYPELADIYPERLDYLRGLGKGATCSFKEAAVYSYVAFRQEIDSWYLGLQPQGEPDHCSGVMFDGPDGVIGGQSFESLPLVPRPRTYKWRKPRRYTGLKQLKTAHPRLILRKPRTGYIDAWGVGNEKGVACFSSVACSVWLDEPIEDTWPVGRVPLLRFARDIVHFAELYQRYTLHNWSRANQIWADTSGNAVAVEKCFRRIGLRWVGKERTLWVTEGHFESPVMHDYMRAKRLEYVARMGRHLGAGDLQYATDCHVRFTHMGELCHEPWGCGYDHIRRVLTDHAPFPRAVCRHGGPDTDSYDTTITMDSSFADLTHNRSFARHWIPWKQFPCQIPESCAQYPARPG